MWFGVYHLGLMVVYYFDVLGLILSIIFRIERQLIFSVNIASFSFSFNWKWKLLAMACNMASNLVAKLPKFSPVQLIDLFGYPVYAETFYRKSAW